MVHMLYKLFPPTIHPMVIHFTIAFIFLTALAGVAGLLFRRDRYFSRTFFYLLILSIFAALAAGIAGSISESYVTSIPPEVRHTFETHKKFGELTGILLLVAFAFQWLKQRKTKNVSIIACLLCLAAVVTVTVAGHLGGDAVYKHGLGVVFGKS